jgi:ribosomal protein S14
MKGLKRIIKTIQRREFIKDNELFSIKNKVASRLGIAVNTHKLTHSRASLYGICLKTGRARWVYRRLQLSRMSLREETMKGFLYGLKKSKW